MLSNVVRDLIPFMIVYLSLIGAFSLMLGVLELGNYKAKGKFYDKYKDSRMKAKGAEYTDVGL